MTAKPLTRSNLCPRCKSGFIVFQGSMDGESSCLNCGHHVLSDIEAAEPDLFIIQTRLKAAAISTVSS
jgi:uncharacterized protein (DUF983 family)